MKKILLILTMIILLTCTVSADNTGYIAGETDYNKRVTEISTGNLKLDPVSLLNSLWDILIKEVQESRTLIINIIVIAAVSGTLNVLQTSFDKNGCSEAAFFSCFTLTAIAVSRLISEVVGYGAEVIDRLTGFITKICPVITIFLVSSGKVASAGSFYPVLSSSIYVVSFVINKCIIPLIYLSTILGIVNNISKRIQLSKLNNLIKSLSKWILTGILTVFTGINTIYGFSVPILDAVSLKALKFTVGSLVPVVGGLVSDTVETVLTGAKLMKNSVGTAGIITVLGICLVPIMKLGAIILMLKLASAVSEPLTDKRISDMISDLVSPITTVFSMLIASSMLFIISIAIIMGAT